MNSYTLQYCIYIYIYIHDCPLRISCTEYKRHNIHGISCLSKGRHVNVYIAGLRSTGIYWYIRHSQVKNQFWPSVTMGWAGGRRGGWDGVGREEEKPPQVKTRGDQLPTDGPDHLTRPKGHHSSQG